MTMPTPRGLPPSRQSRQGPVTRPTGKRRHGSISPYLLFGVVSLGLAVALAAGLTLLIGQPQRLGARLALWVCALSIIAALIYGLDKSQARRGGLRVPEGILHALTLLGGSPGAFLAMQALRHKTGKRNFQLVFWAIVAVQAAIVAYLFLR